MKVKEEEKRSQQRYSFALYTFTLASLLAVAQTSTKQVLQYSASTFSVLFLTWTLRLYFCLLKSILPDSLQCFGVYEASLAPHHHLKTITKNYKHKQNEETV